MVLAPRAVKHSTTCFQAQLGLPETTIPGAALRCTVEESLYETPIYRKACTLAQLQLGELWLAFEAATS